MSIKTWHERAMLIDVNNRQITPVYMQAEIDELRVALQEQEEATRAADDMRTQDQVLLEERDAEIKSLKGRVPEDTISNQRTIQENPRGAIEIMQRQNKKITAQRKVLEQALEAFTETISMYLEWHKDFPEHVGDKEKPVVQLALASITAIQEQLKS